MPGLNVVHFKWLNEDRLVHHLSYIDMFPCTHKQLANNLTNQVRALKLKGVAVRLY